ncbi:hypothetical protein [Flavobacterium sp.]|jgi:hypothetical protein|uniref:hypothetical protein n=1 Tax=Flavobacterium sp. TaxID=239 RepID=UPI0037C194F9
MISKIKYEYLLGFIAIIWILFFAYVIQLKAGFSSLGDDGSYLYSARLLYFNHKIDNTRPLLISAINGFPYLFGFSNHTTVKFGIFINFLCWFFTSVLLFKIISKILNRKKAFLLSVIFIFCIGNLAHAFNFLSESIFIFMILLSIYFVSKYYETTKYYFITIAIAVLLFNTLIKPVSIGLALILIFFFISKFKRIIFNKLSFLLLASFLLIIYQMYSLKKNYGDFTISYISSITYYNYLGDKADCYKKGIEYLPAKTERSKKYGLLSSNEMKKTAENDFKSQFNNNTYNLFKAYLFCMYSNTHKGNYIVSECNNEKGTSYFNVFYFLFKAISKLQNILFTIFGVSLSFYCLLNFNKIDKFYLMNATFILYIFFISAISCFQCDRFHIVFYPIVLLLLLIFLKNIKNITNKYIK